MKKTFLKALSLICATILALLSLCACQQESNTEATDGASELFTVTFNSNGGTDISPIEVYRDQTVAEPAAPSRENYIFRYWECDGRRWTFHISKVTSNITLSALWIPAYEVFELEPTDNPDEVLISGFSSQKELNEVIIPEIINGKKIVGLTEGAFEAIHDSYAKKLILPKTAKYMNKSSLANISSVHIELTGPVATVGESTFENCAHLEGVTLTQGIEKIPYRCFAGASALETIDLPSGVSLIEENAFDSCVSLSSIFLPATVNTVEDSAFANTPNLSAVVYEGSKEDFEKIDIADKNDSLLSAKIYFYSEAQPSVDGDFWHYDEDNKPVLW